MRYLTGVRKVGHAGTLDPFANGVLLICTGKATKNVNSLMEFRKEYVGQIFLGAQTDTDDLTGRVIRTSTLPEMDRQVVEEVCRQFIGGIVQIPPMYSAKKVGGRRLYQIARKGGVVERRPQLVTVDSLDILQFDPPMLTIRVICSKGTYIRALARDIGELLNCGAHLHALTRTRIGDYRIEDSLTIEQFTYMLKGETQWQSHRKEN